jgi:hypothetical protein
MWWDGGDAIGLATGSQGSTLIGDEWMYRDMDFR